MTGHEALESESERERIKVLTAFPKFPVTLVQQTTSFAECTYH